MTDADGFAIIAASRYDTLVWNNNNRDFRVVEYVSELKTILENQIQKKSVSAIFSGAYDSMILKDNHDEYSIKKTSTKLTKNLSYNISGVRKLEKKNDSTYLLKEQANKSLVFNGIFTTSFEVRSRNAVPETQNRYVQGRSSGGKLIWRGPETNELFSFGPDISILSFDNAPYEYDFNGGLIAQSAGLRPASIYNNSLFKDAFSYNNLLNIGTVFKKNGKEKLKLTVDLGQQKNQSYLENQYDVGNHFKTKISGNIFNFFIRAGYQFNEAKATNTNRIGLYNRSYQNSLLTPVSFSNKQSSYLINGMQRRYSGSADNPGFLFDQQNKNNFQNKRRNYSLNLTKNWRDLKVDIAQSYDEEKILNKENYKPSTAGFADGIFNSRNQDNYFYNATIRTSYNFGGNLVNTFSLDHTLTDQNVTINHSLGRFYHYQRTAQDYIFNYKMKYHLDDILFVLNVGNSVYASSSSLKNHYWLPKVNAYITFDDIFDLNRMDVTLVGAYTALTSEPDMSKSYGSFATTLLSAQNANLFFPIEEVNSFKNLNNIDVKEWKAGIKINYGYKLNLEAEYFNKKVFNDVFPVFQKDNLILKNLADHTYSGFDVGFSYDNIRIGRYFISNQKASFFKYMDVVNRMEVGYNNTAITGFNDIHKVLSVGENIGVITGSYYERDAAGQLIIDEFGYPKKADNLKVIADPNPDFVMKFTHEFYYKNLSLDINWEWKKGGEVWNGTQAVLDYYGRSQNSADLRNTQNYIFEGVNGNGNTNQIPVNFYDVNQDVTENRWTRYGYLGVAEAYVEKADYIRINNISLTADFNIGNLRRALGITFFVNNILLWQPKSGVDPSQNFYNLENGNSLDFFNLPSFKTYGCAVSLQF